MILFHLRHLFEVPRFSLEAIYIAGRFYDRIFLFELTGRTTLPMDLMDGGVDLLWRLWKVDAENGDEKGMRDGGIRHGIC